VGPRGAWGQQQVMPVVGFLRGTSGAVSTRFVASFRQGLKEAGFIEGQNVAVEYRYADNQLERLPLLAAELIRHKPAVIVANYGISNADLNLRAASYVDRILRGANVGDLPVEAPTKFELIVNLKTAKAFGLKIPEAFLLRADEVIE